MKKYNQALKDEKKRQEDFINNYFTKAVVIPTRPCQGGAPLAYSGPSLKLGDAIKTSPVQWSTVTSGTD